MSQILFVTGTDTGVGKTLLTALLLTYWRQQRRDVAAMKPFCSGGLNDARILFRVQAGQLPIESICPFPFDEPLAPYVAAKRAGRVVRLAEVLGRIQELAAGHELLLVEGAGGLLAPLGEGFTAADVISSLHCPAVLVARNKLGAINHTLLTQQALRALGVPKLMIALSDTSQSDLATETNGEFLPQFAFPDQVLRIPYLGPRATRLPTLSEAAKKLKKTLAPFAEMSIFSSAFPEMDERI